MTDAVQVPDFLYRGVPDDASPGEALYMRAQVVIQAAFYALGDRNYLPDTATLDRKELTEILTFAAAMLVAGDKDAKTSRDVRLQAEAVGKSVHRTATMLRDAGDNVVDQLFAAMGVWSSSVN